MRFMLVAASLTLSVLVTVDMTEAQVITKNPDGYIASISGLSINGTIYDVTFNYNASFDEVYSTDSPPTSPPTFWGDATGAEAARDAIRDVLNGSVTNDGSSVNRLFVPYEFVEPGTLGSEQVRSAVTSASASSSTWIDETIAPIRTTPAPDGVAYATFSVPEPSSFIVCCGLVAGGGLYRRRRSRKSRSSSTPRTS